MSENLSSVVLVVVGCLEHTKNEIPNNKKCSNQILSHRIVNEYEPP